jgi:hypothetical protein
MASYPYGNPPQIQDWPQKTRGTQWTTLGRAKWPFLSTYKYTGAKTIKSFSQHQLKVQMARHVLFDFSGYRRDPLNFAGRKWPNKIEGPYAQNQLKEIESADTTEMTTIKARAGS